MNLSISQELVQKLITYLVKQPYMEVFQFVPELSRLKVVKEEPEKEPKETA